MNSGPPPRSGPLDGIGVVELVGIGPAPLACSYLEELGATVVRIERSTSHSGLPDGLAGVGRRPRASLALNLKDPKDVAVAVDVIRGADVVIEGFRPGVTERLGIGPAEMIDKNQRLVYLRMTGWGQMGPMATMAGHDINYIGLNGVLASIGPSDHPVPPLNLVGDYGGGTMFAVSGILAALVERATTGRGQVIDAAMVDGSATLLGPTRDLVNAGLWSEHRASNLLDGGAPFYRTYRTSDDEFMAVGALEPMFYSAMVHGLGLDEGDLEDRLDPANWKRLGEVFAGIFAERSRSHWTDVFDGTDACVTPVLRMAEVADHPHNLARGALTEGPDGLVPSSAPRFSERYVHQDTDGDDRQLLETSLGMFGIPGESVADLTERGVASWS